MSNDKKFNILTVLTVLFFTFILVTMILSGIFPGEQDAMVTGMPWYAWVVLGGTLGYVTAMLVIFCVMYRHDGKLEKRTKTE